MKKKKADDERHAPTFVPKEEQPYEVPANWRWVRWGFVGELVAGTGFKEQYQGFTDYTIPFYKVGSLKYCDSNGYIFDNSNTINEEIRRELKANVIPVNAVIFAKIGEAIRLNRRCLNTVPCCIDNNLMAFIPQKCASKYSYYWSKSIDLYNYTNATTVPAIRKSDLEDIPFPLPPNCEQRRIVDRVERLFAALDAAKEKAQAVLAGCETRKAAILHKAFTGQLSTKTMSWGTSLFGELIEEVKLGLIRSKSEQSASAKYGYLKMNNIASDGALDLSNLLRVNATQEEASSYSLMNGDFLFNTRNSYELVGKNTVWNAPLEETVLFNNNIMRVRFKRHINPFFVSCYLNSTHGKSSLKQIKKNTTNVAAIYAKDLYKIEIPVPSLDEQNEIVQILCDFSMQEQRLNKITTHVISSIDALKRSILARAFRGELGTNDPTEPPASL